ncbi:MAG: S41 family peptidase [Chroococcidiopsidaceae cyanobacterium CP_BM_RX_35]|nr:S41 family peptidase [Chroococcidiopsidaceae cyanobacterium CP_BM_RX_35]
MLQFLNRFSLLQVTLICGTLVTTAALPLVSPIGSCSVLSEFKDSPKAVVDEVWQIVNSEYVDRTFNHVNWLATRRQLLNHNYTSRQQAYTAIRVALKQLGDPYTRFLDPQQYQTLSDETSGKMAGIGVVTEQTDNQQLRVVKVLENSPASKAKIQPGDKILAVDGRSTQGKTIEEILKLIGGRAGTPVTLRMEQQGHRDFEVKLIRADIKVPTLSYTLKQEGVKRIGYIRLTEFDATSPQEMQQAIKVLQAKQVDGYVLDLRGNPGGLVDASVAIARMWLEQGAIVREVDRAGDGEEMVATHTALTKLPLVVLVDGDSASASEILTGALQDNHRATVVGSQTFGKGLIQEISPLSDGSGIAVTVEHYFTPNGTDINHKGITPDVKVNLTLTQQQQLETVPDSMATLSDPQYIKAENVLNLLISDSKP